MYLNAISGPIYTFCVWFYRLAFINLLWILFTILGLGLFGVFPATVALLATLRQLINQNDGSIFKTFWTFYKEEFIKSNGVGLCVVLLSLILISNIQFLQTMNTGLSQFFYLATIITACFFLLVVCYFLSLYVEFQAPIKTHLKNAFLLAIYNPVASLTMIFGFFAVYLLITFVSGIGLFFSMSALGLVVLSSAKLAFRKVIRDDKLSVNNE
ncbi:YesL family protein [Alkalicoccobacillus gibsonii]|uniref:YesL family protein n=1 Tax=Alkalicoccobacillus gibsonii TaxID=79881 RepID=UPI0035114B1C